ncbi:MAG: DUF3793 family protein [Lachnospiraceae bacterium]|nr:DUF3793 family protein [Lachnospiraceae bacterium]
MPEESLVIHCSPTLAGLKTGSLFTVEYTQETKLMDEIRRLNRTLAVKGLRVIPMRETGGRVLIYVYRPSKLEKDLADKRVSRILEEMGYSCGRPEQCVVYLAKKLREGQSFPHEIGLFPGYPLEDVQGFIENKAGNFKYIGCWKVYGDVEQAQKKFHMFKKCANIYYTQWLNGFSIERLTVAA